MFGQSLLSAFGSAACTTDTDQLFTTDVQTTSVATYQLNNATTSIPSNTYPGTANNITYATGKFGNAAVFNGSSSSIGISSSTINPANVYSLSMWVNFDNASAYTGFFANNTSAFRVGEISIMKPNATKLQVLSGGQAGTNLLDNLEAQPSSSFVNNTWYHIVVISDRSISNQRAKVFVNGIECSYIHYGANQSSVSTYSDTKIGLADNQYFPGKIDQVRIFNSSLPQPAITALYNETTTTAQSASVDYQLANPNSVAYYKMSDATDQFGNYNGTATNVNFNTEGKFGFAGAFNGSSSKIVLPASTVGTIVSNGSFAISGWFNTSTTGTRQFIFSAFQSSYIMLEVTTGNQLKGTVSNTVGTNSELTVSTTVTDGNWHHVVFTGDSSSLSLYLDNGTPQTSTSWNGSFYSGTGGVGIGIRMTSSDYWNGSIDQIRIYDSALSAANVTTLYNEIECPAVAVTNAFNTVLYTGDGASSKSITSLGFKPDMIWIKARSSAYSHNLQDSVRGGGASTALTPNVDVAEGTYGIYGFVNTFDSNGFTVGTGSSNNIHVNNNNTTYVSWNWKAGGTAVSNTDGAITSQVSANVDAGFSIVEWSSSGGVGTVGHGLDEVPQLIIIKKTASSSPWSVYAAPVGNDKRLQLNESAAAATDSIWNNTTPTNKVFTEQISGGATTDNIAYCFHSVAGYSKVGSYVGTGAAGNSIFTGFEPAFVMFKNTNAGNVWTIFDNKRNPTNPVDLALFPNLGNAEYDYPTNGISFNTNGFTLNSAGAEYNENTYSYIFLAIA